MSSGARHLVIRYSDSGYGPPEGTVAAHIAICSAAGEVAVAKFGRPVGPAAGLYFSERAEEGTPSRLFLVGLDGKELHHAAVGEVVRVREHCAQTTWGTWFRATTHGPKRAPSSSSRILGRCGFRTWRVTWCSRVGGTSSKSRPDRGRACSGSPKKVRTRRHKCFCRGPAAPSDRRRPQSSRCLLRERRGSIAPPWVS